MLKSKYEENDLYSIEHKNYTVIQSNPNSPLALYISTDINKYAYEILKNCNGIIEDSENDAIEFINNQAVDEDIQEKYVSFLTTVISDISVIENKKLWPQMLAEGIVKKTVFNVINYYIEYCLDSQLIQFINECDTGMDYSKTERVFGSEIANQFFDTIAVSNEIETKK